ncbi:MAG: WG repeat-containing protein, partial [Candidatus Zixiibacteriota bacterium]
MKKIILFLIFMSLLVFFCKNKSPDELFRIMQNGKWGYINKQGEIIIKPQFDHTDDFSEGLAAVSINYKWGYIDKTGKIVIPLQFGGASSFREGLAHVGG